MRKDVLGVPALQIELCPRRQKFETSLRQPQTAFAREHGYCFYVRNPRVAQGDPDSAFNAERNEFPVELPSVLKPDQDYELASVVAPVFDESRQVLFVLGLYLILSPPVVPTKTFIGLVPLVLAALTFAGLYMLQPNEAALLSQYHPPFNRVSNYREPGRVNPSGDAREPRAAVGGGSLRERIPAASGLGER